MNWDTDGVSLTLQSRDYKDPQCVVIQTEPIVLESNQNHATITDSGICPTLSASMGLGGGYVPMITEQVKQSDDPVEVAQPVTANYGMNGNNQPLVVENNPTDDRAKINPDGVFQTLCGRAGTGGNNVPLVAEPVTLKIRAGCSGGGKGALWQTAKGPGAVCSHYIVRRLTPLECERLQGLPDRWTDIGDWVDEKGKTHKCSDAARYKAIGNGIAVPPWLWVLSRLNQFCKDKTMASLFDGVGTFPMIWSFLNGKENCVWSSEIEPFPIAVSKYHFPDEDESEQE